MIKTWRIYSDEANVYFQWLGMIMDVTFCGNNKAKTNIHLPVAQGNS